LQLTTQDHPGTS